MHQYYYQLDHKDHHFQVLLHQVHKSDIFTTFLISIRCGSDNNDLTFLDGTFAENLTITIKKNRTKRNHRGFRILYETSGRFRELQRILNLLKIS
jgi:hypothetical protein